MSVVDLRVWGVEAVTPALWRTATGRRRLRSAPGLRFARLLGTGSGETFAPRDADPHHWALLTVWDDATAAECGARHPVVTAWDDAAHERLALRLRPLGSRGRWGGQEPFEVADPPGGVRRAGATGPVAALTRARLRASTAQSFRRAVPAVVRALREAEGLRLALGVGEAPVLLQGTFSVWESASALEGFARGAAAHREAVRRTRPARWYTEELFARFAVEHLDGTYRGRTP